MCLWKKDYEHIYSNFPFRWMAYLACRIHYQYGRKGSNAFAHNVSGEHLGFENIPDIVPLSYWVRSIFSRSSHSSVPLLPPHLPSFSFYNFNKSFSKIFKFYLKTAVLAYNSHTMSFTYLKYELRIIWQMCTSRKTSPQ